MKIMWYWPWYPIAAKLFQEVSMFVVALPDELTARENGRAAGFFKISTLAFTHENTLLLVFSLSRKIDSLRSCHSISNIDVTYSSYIFLTTRSSTRLTLRNKYMRTRNAFLREIKCCVTCWHVSHFSFPKKTLSLKSRQGELFCAKMKGHFSPPVNWLNFSRLKKCKKSKAKDAFYHDLIVWI